jgi:hypothetical protein
MSSLVMGRVVDVHPRTHTIDVDINGELLHGVVLLLVSHDPDLGGGTTILPKIGSTAVIDTGPFEDMPGLCIGYVKGGHESIRTAPGDESNDAPTSPTAENSEIAAKNVSPLTQGPKGAEDALLGASGEESRTEGDPGDAYPGDFIHRASSGNAIGVLEGGVNIFKASDLAKIEANALDDLIRIVARNFELETELGSLRIGSNKGKAFLKFTGNENVTQNQKGEYTIEFGVFPSFADSPKGSDIFNFTVTAQGGRDTLVDFRVSGTGDISVGGHSITTRESLSSDVHTHACHQKDIYVENGSLERNRGSSRLGSESIVLYTDPDEIPEVGVGEVLIGGTQSVSLVSSGAVSTASGKSFESVMGYVPGKDMLPIPGTTAKSIEVANGDFVTNVGSPFAMGLPSFMSTYEVNTWSGDIRLNAGPMGSVIINSYGAPSPKGSSSQHGIHLNALSVMIGAPPTGPICAAPPKLFQAVLFEPLQQYLTQLHLWLDTHVHPTAVGPSGPPAAPSSTLSGLHAAFMSKIVQLGG